MKAKLLILFLLTIFSCRNKENTKMPNNESRNLLAGFMSDMDDSLDSKGNYYLALAKNSDNKIILLSLNCEKLRAVPLSILNFVDLIDLKLGNLKLDSFIDLSSLNELKRLTFKNGELNKISFRDFPRSLEALELSDLGLTDTLIIDATLPNLDYLNISFNKISFVKILYPDSLKNLRTINLSVNEITTLDKSIYELPNLRSINLLGNKIDSIDLTMLKNLYKIGLEDSVLFKSDANRNEFEKRKLLRDTLIFSPGRKSY